MNETISNKVLELARNFHPEIREDSFILDVFRGTIFIDFSVELSTWVKDTYDEEIPFVKLLRFREKGTTIRELITHVEGVCSPS